MPTPLTWYIADPPVPVTQPRPETTAPASSLDAPRDLLLDSDGSLSAGDLSLAPGSGDLIVASGRSALLQDLRSRLRFFQGEWFLDRQAGVPYFKEVLVRDPDLTRIRTLLQNEILATPGVRAVTSMTMNYNPTQRTLEVSFRASTDFGEVAGTTGGDT